MFDDGEETYSTYSYVNDEGRLETLDVESGELIAISPDPHLPADPRVSSTPSRWVLNETYRQYIVQLLLEGKTLSEIYEIEGMPPRHILYQWRTLDPEFDALIKDVKRYKAEIFMDDIEKRFEIDPNDPNKEFLLKARKQFTDERFKLAERYNQQEYGNKVSHEIQDKRPVKMVIETGVPDEDVEIDLPESFKEDIELTKGEHYGQSTRESTD